MDANEAGMSLKTMELLTVDVSAIPNSAGPWPCRNPNASPQSRTDTASPGTLCRTNAATELSHDQESGMWRVARSKWERGLYGLPANGLTTRKPWKRLKSRSPVSSSETPCSEHRVTMCASWIKLPVAHAWRITWSSRVTWRSVSASRTSEGEARMRSKSSSATSRVTGG